MNRARHALPGVPRKGSVARYAKHLVAPVNLGDVDSTLGALLRVSTQLLHSGDVIGLAFVIGFMVDGLMATGAAFVVAMLVEYCTVYDTLLFSLQMVPGRCWCY